MEKVLQDIYTTISLLPVTLSSLLSMVMYLGFNT